MKPADLDALNALLEPLGERVCALCGARHPLDADHFPEYRAGLFRKECRWCYSFGHSMRKSEKYAQDEAVREATIKASKAYYAEHRQARLEHNQAHRKDKAQCASERTSCYTESASD